MPRKPLAVPYADRVRASSTHQWGVHQRLLDQSHHPVGRWDIQRSGTDAINDIKHKRHEKQALNYVHAGGGVMRGCRGGVQRRRVVFDATEHAVKPPCFDHVHCL